MGESCYIAVAGPENDIGECRDSIEQMTTRPGDRLWFARGTKGYEVRQTHFNRFIESDHDWLLMLDHDMVYAPDTLERLRGHGQPYVSGYYLQRRYQPMIPVWFHAGDEWPLRPFLEIPESRRLHELGGSGWGCVLIHRRVVEDVRAKVLKGELDVIEDDMDVLPYDLTVIMRALASGDIETLRREIRPLRGQFDRQPVGSDLRYPVLARQVGYQLMGDPDVRPSHMVQYPLAYSDYTAQATTIYEAVMAESNAAAERGNHRWRAHMKGFTEES